MHPPAGTSLIEGISILKNECQFTTRFKCAFAKFCAVCMHGRCLYSIYLLLASGCSTCSHRTNYQCAARVSEEILGL